MTYQDLATISERYFEQKMAAEPFTATMFGVPGFDDQVGDPSRAGDERRLAELEETARALSAIDPSGLTGQDRITYAMLGLLIKNERADIAGRTHELTVSAGITGVHTGILSSMPATPLPTPRRAADYLTRLRALEGFFDAVLERYRQAGREGRHQVARSVRQAIEQLDGYLATDVAADPLLQPAPDDDWRAEAQKIVAEHVRPALARWRTAFAEEFLPVARDDARVGICHVPGGTEAYLAAARSHTTTDLTPEEIHQIGLDVITRLREEFSEIGGRALGTSDADEVMAALRTDLALRFETADEIVASATDALARANAALADWFLPYDIAPCEVREIPALAAKDSVLAYYSPPAADGSRPGIHWINTYDPPSRARFEYEALAFHESVPGHHLQLAVSQTLDDLPAFRRFGHITAFGEGWGLYTERLTDEMGLYSTDLTRLGMLSFDAWRACRLVVDTGMHHLGWSRERAVQFMRDNSAASESNINNEIDRYIAWPGQALAYMIGRLRILELRSYAEAELGEGFDVKEFHHRVLSSGSVPLDTLGQIVEEWVASGGAKPVSQA